jgi:AAA domain, putative AbiEii toxin, Type IV TA system/AAA domain
MTPEMAYFECMHELKLTSTEHPSVHRPRLSPMLQSLKLQDVGPTDRLAIEFGDRLNIITGDNGLGKSFLLEVAWWALTRSWAAGPALPNKGAERQACLSYRVDAKGGPVENDVDFNVDRQGWFHGPGRPPIPGFIVYARVDGSFAVMDPSRNDPPEDDGDGPPAYRRRPTAFFFDSDQVWSGLKTDDTTLCNGLIADWHVWQLEDSQEFSALRNVLSVLSPDPNERLEPGQSRRIDLFDAREIPTLRMPYGEVPVTQVSAGARRILALSYLLVWAWHEHRAASELLGEPPSDRVTLLIDEVEAHLHPRWQRVILPAILEALRGLGAPADSQVISVTHSPLVLASLEGLWEDEHDRLFRLDLVGLNNGEPHVELTQEEWRARGDVNRWLTSDIFGLGQARSRPAEEIIERARALMVEPHPDQQELGKLAEQLARYVPETDALLGRIDALASTEDA